MNENRTASILQRFAVILAVTAASYGLPPQAQAGRAQPQAQTARAGGNGQDQQAHTAGQQR